MRWLIRVAGSLALLVVLVLAGLFLVPTERIANLAAGEFRKMTGRELRFEGAVRPTVWPHLGVRTGTVVLANAAWSDAGPMLSAEGVSIAVDLQALLGGAVRVTGIDLIRPRLLLERAADGRVNWTFAPEGGAAEPAAPAEGGAGRPLGIDRAVMTDGTVVMLDHRAGTRQEVSGISLDARLPDWQGAAEISASARMNGQAMQVKGRIGSVAALAEGKVVPVALTAAIGGSEVTFDGRAGLDPMAAEGRIEAALGDLGAVTALAGLAAPDLPEGLGRRSIALEGEATLTAAGSVHLREGSVTLDGNRFSGAFDLVPGKTRPRLTAQLVTGDLDLKSLGGGGGGGGGSAGPTGWSTAPIDVSGLGAMDAAISLAADSVDLGSVAFGRTRLSATIDAARAVVDLREVAAYGGTLSGQVILNGRKGFSTRLDLAFKGLSLEPLLAALAEYDRLSGTGDMRFNVLASGGSLDALMRSLDGEGSLAFRNGELRGLDIAGMIRTLDTGYVGEGSKTVFDSVTASFTLAGGVLSNGDLALAAPLITAGGAGRVDVGNRTLDYRVTPLSLGGQALGPDVQVPVVLGGSWDSPSVRLDLETLARRKLEEEAKKLEEKAREELARRAEEELGIVAQDGESLEDLARRAAEEALQQEAARALERLLGGAGLGGN